MQFIRASNPFDKYMKLLWPVSDVLHFVLQLTDTASLAQIQLDTSWV